MYFSKHIHEIWEYRCSIHELFKTNLYLCLCRDYIIYFLILLIVRLDWCDLGFVKIDTWISLDFLYMDLLIVKIDTCISLRFYQICKSWYMDFSKLVRRFARLLHVFLILFQTKLTWSLTKIIKLVEDSASDFKLNNSLSVERTNFTSCWFAWQVSAAIHNWFQQLKLVDWLKELNKVHALGPLCLWQCFLSHPSN